ncbi:hypothetical protein SeLEV6574_g05600 [Synchytrium endobioticum]|uniref:BTB domain-containing protein n=1 Tax=Synchytrium endobioticum TaxID=286115 RepID=A0A507CTH0_9FUNG|nr:hypothetical protein SeLEV6574_g05600 [Synchytrium endobioticum]
MMMKPEVDAGRRRHAVVAIEWIALTRFQNFDLTQCDARDLMRFGFERDLKLVCWVIQNSKAVKEVDIGDACGVSTRDDSVLLLTPDDKSHDHTGLVVSRSQTAQISSVLNTMLTDTRWREGGSRHVSIYQVSLQDMKNLMSWTQSSTRIQDASSVVRPPLDAILGLLTTADRFLVEELKQACINHLHYRLLQAGSGNIDFTTLSSTFLKIFNAVHDRISVTDEVKTLLIACCRGIFASLSGLVDQDLASVYDYLGGRDMAIRFVVERPGGFGVVG